MYKNPVKVTIQVTPQNIASLLKLTVVLLETTLVNMNGETL